MPSVIGTAVPHDHMGNRLAVSIGSTVIDPGVVAPSGDVYTFARTLDRTFSGHPTWGGGNVNNGAVGNRRADFEHNGANWELWQVIPFDGPAISGQLGACRVHLRNRSKGRGQNQLAEMPDRLELSAGAGQTADWIGLPWAFTRTTSAAQFTNVAGGAAARKAVTYIPARVNPGASPAAVGIAQGESFTVALFFDP